MLVLTLCGDVSVELLVEVLLFGIRIGFSFIVPFAGGILNFVCFELTAAAGSENLFCNPSLCFGIGIFSCSHWVLHLRFGLFA